MTFSPIGTMAQRKRKHEEFAEDPAHPCAQDKSKVSERQPVPSSTMGNILSNRGTDEAAPALPDQGSINGTANGDNEWQVSLSKKARKKQRKRQKAAEGEPTEPSLYYHNKILNPLRIKDLQALVLYVLSDGVAPIWVALRNGKKIDQVVVVMVPGMDKDMLHAFTSAAQTLQQDHNADDKEAKSPEASTPSTVISEDAGGANEDTSSKQGSMPKALPNSALPECIIPVKAPGDDRAGKIYSSLQAMLISPEPKANKGAYKGADNVLAAVRTPLPHFVHSAEELVEAEYPVHPAIFTNPNDSELEKSRREGAEQSSMMGWVDSDVTITAPVSMPGTINSEDLASGMQVYALDCEMVLTTDDVYSLARISVLNWHGKTIVDKFVKPALPVKDYFTQFSGITAKLLEGVTTTLEDIQKELLTICTSSTILLGHSLESDFNALKFTHPFIIDTAIVYPHPRGLPLRSRLKYLANKYLKREIQKGGADGHDSVEDARAVLDLVRLKCEKGPKWGTMDVNGESIFARLNASGNWTAIVEHGTPERGLGRLASIHVGCQDDNEIAAGLVRMMSLQGPKEKVNFAWGRLREMEKFRGWNWNSYQASSATQNGESVNGDDTESQLKEASERTVANLVHIYDSLAPSTLFMIFPGNGDMREVNRLQDMQKQYRKEFKVKKWNELTVKWTDDEMQALRKATEKARRGWGLVCLK